MRTFAVQRNAEGATLADQQQHLILDPFDAAMSKLVDSSMQTHIVCG